MGVSYVLQRVDKNKHIFRLVKNTLCLKQTPRGWTLKKDLLINIMQLKRSAGVQVTPALWLKRSGQCNNEDFSVCQRPLCSWKRHDSNKMYENKNYEKVVHANIYDIHKLFFFCIWASWHENLPFCAKFNGRLQNIAEMPPWPCRGKQNSNKAMLLGGKGSSMYFMIVMHLNSGLSVGKLS